METGNVLTHDPFPRVSARRTEVVVPQHLRPKSAGERIAGSAERTKRLASAATSATTGSVDALLTHRVTLGAVAAVKRAGTNAFQRVKKVDRTYALAGGGITALTLALAGIVSMGVRNDADAATTMTSAYHLPAGTVAVAVGSDGDLAAAMRRASIAPGDVDRVVQEARDHGIMQFRPGAVIGASLASGRTSDAFHEISSIELRTGLGKAIDFTRDAKNQLIAHDRSIAVVEAPLRITGKFGGDVRGTLAQYGLGKPAIDDFVRIIGAQMSIADISRGDRFDVVLDRQRAADGMTRNRGIMYAGLARQDGGDLSMSQWTVRGKLAWFDAYKASHSIDNVQRPVSGDVTSSFGMRFHPLLGFTRLHAGIDYRAAVGTPILAAQSGWVEHAGWAGGYGNQVKLRHGGGIETSYSHMSRTAAAPGTFVSQGQVIGYAGATGLATGPHLHFEVIRGGQKIDPSLVTFSVGPQLRGADLVGYHRRLDALVALPVERSQPIGTAS